MRVVAACVALGLAFSPALAADPKVEAAVKSFKAVGGDQGKLKTFCDMLKAMDAAGDTPSPAAQSQIDGYTKQLGPEFVAAWSLGETLDETSDDGKAWGEALDELATKCPD
jgi:hypothetical protein